MQIKQFCIPFQQYDLVKYLFLIIVKYYVMSASYIAEVDIGRPKSILPEQ